MNLDVRKPKNPEALEIRDADLPAEVRPLIEGVHGQIHGILARYGVVSIEALMEKLHADSGGAQVARRNMLAAQKDIAHLTTLTEKLKFLLDQPKTVDAALADRARLVEVTEKARFVLKLREFSNKVRPIGVMRIMEADLAVKGESRDMMERLLRTVEFAEAETEHQYRFFRVLGRHGRFDDAEALWTRTAKGFNQRLKAAYATGLTDADVRDELLAEACSGIDADESTALGDLAEIARIAHDAGCDIRETLAKIEEYRLAASASGMVYDSMDNLTLLYADLGMEEHMAATVHSRTDIDLANERLGIAYVKQGKIEDAERILAEIRESLEPTNLVCHLLPFAITSDSWEILGMGDDEEYMRFTEGDEEQYTQYLLTHHPNLLPVFYEHMRHVGVPVSHTVEALYARFLATQNDEESQGEFVTRRAACLRVAEAALAAQKEFLESLETREDTTPWDVLEGAMRGGAGDLELPLAHYIIATHSLSEVTAPLVTTLCTYVQELCRKDDSSRDIDYQRYNRRMYAVVNALASAGLFDEADSCCRTMHPAGAEVDNTISSEAAFAGVLLKKLDAAIAKEALAHDVLKKVGA